MASKDIKLGFEVQTLLKEKLLETPMWSNRSGVNYKEVQTSFDRIMNIGLGLDMNDESLRGTPNRVAKMFCEEVFYGLDYSNFPECTVVPNNMKYDEMIAGKCAVKSMCEHHFVPFMGEAHVAYIPKDKVLGLSKFNRVIDFFCRRPQIQERLTEQVAAALQLILETEDIALVIKAQHFCVHLRGVQDSLSETTTSKMLGRFRSVDSLRAEFLALTR